MNNERPGLEEAQGSFKAAQLAARYIKTETVGLIVVHGIGEQKPGEHLETVARPLAEALAGEHQSVTIKALHPKPGRPSAEITVQRAGDAGKRVTVSLHEVYWADINEPNSFGKGIRFWLWGLSAWRWAGKATIRNPTFDQTLVNPSFGLADEAQKRLLRDLRQQLFIVGWAFALAAPAFIFLDFIAKRVFQTRLPASIASLVSYVSAVKLYSQPRRAGRGMLDSAIEPPRYAIRRRMAGTIADMAIRGYDRWFIAAHSQGTVVAQNGLMAAAPALMAYLDDEHLDMLESLGMAGPRRGAGDGPTADKLAADLDFRPTVPAHRIGIDRTVYCDRLYSRFRGMLTYGSPLDKFAAIWAPTVALCRDAKVFPKDARWVNVWDPSDPISAALDAFDSQAVIRANPGTEVMPDRSDCATLDVENVPYSAASLLAEPPLLSQRPGWWRAIAGSMVGPLARRRPV